MNIFDLGIDEQDVVLLHSTVLKKLNLKTAVRTYNKYANANGLVTYPNISTFYKISFTQSSYAEIVEGFEFLLDIPTMVIEGVESNIFSVLKFWEEVGRHGYKLILKVIGNILALSKVDKGNSLLGILNYFISTNIHLLDINLQHVAEDTVTFKRTTAGIVSTRTLDSLSLVERNRLTNIISLELEYRLETFRKHASQVYTYLANLIEQNPGGTNSSLFKYMEDTEYPRALAESFDIDINDANSLAQLLKQISKVRPSDAIHLYADLARYDFRNANTRIFHLIVVEPIREIFNNSRITYQRDLNIKLDTAVI